MADVTDTGEGGELNDSVISDVMIDLDMESILQNIHSKPMDVILEEFGQYNAEILTKNREVLFNHAKIRYVTLLSIHGIDNIPVLKMRRKQGDRAQKRLTSDVYELYRFVQVITDILPKELLFDSSRYITLQKNFTQVIEKCGGKGPSSDTMETVQKITELKLKDGEKDKKISELETKVTGLEKKLELVEKSHNSLKSELAAIKLLIVGINNDKTKPQTGGNKTAEFR